MSKKLKAPFPWFGGKSAVARLIWDRLGDVDNCIECFAGSAAFLLARPHPPRIETLNDADCYIANFWRATSRDPEAVAEYADYPVNECDLHSRHKWLVLSEAAAEFRAKMRSDPDHYDARIAGWWCWGLCCWIGSGWCSEPNGELTQQIIAGQRTLTGVHANGPAGGTGDRSPILGGGQGQYGHGIHAKGLKDGARPYISNPHGALGHGVHGGSVHSGLPARGPDDTHRPQLADAFSLGRGVHAGSLSIQRPALGDYAGGCGVNADAIAIGTCAQRRAWLLDWFGRLRDRLRCVRVCCGDWSRVCSSPSVTTRLGTTGVFLDPPYGALAGRDAKLYSTDSLTVAAECRAWCLEWGTIPQMRIALCGYAGEGHEELEAKGWQCVAWKAAGGYGNRSEQGKANAAKERLWFSPGCRSERTLFDGLVETTP